MELYMSGIFAAKTTAVFLLCFGLIRLTAAHTYTDKDNLMNDLLVSAGYNKNIRPTTNQSVVTTVHMAFAIHSLESVDTHNSLVKVSGHLYFTWTDELLVWDPEKHGNITKLSLPTNQFWKPKIALVESSIEENDLMDSKTSISYVSHTGVVFWAPLKTLVSRCDIDATNYPFDSHTCRFTFMVIELDSSEAILTSTRDSIDISYLDKAPNGEWSTSSTATKDVILPDSLSTINASMVQYTMIVTRRHWSVAIRSLMPILFILLLNVVTFLLPVQSGERVSFSVTLYLAYIFMSISIADTMPRNSLKMSYFSIQILVINIHIFMWVILSVLQIRLANRREDEFPITGLMSKLTLYMKRRRQRRHRATPKNVTDCNRVVKLAETESENTDTCTTESNKPKEDTVTENEHIIITWVDVTETIDTVYLICSLTSVGIICYSFTALMTGMDFGKILSN